MVRWWNYGTLVRLWYVGGAMVRWWDYSTLVELWYVGGTMVRCGTMARW